MTGKNNLLNLIQKTLKSKKAKDIITIDNDKIKIVADYMIIASGTSSKNIQSIAQHIAQNIKKNTEYKTIIDNPNANEWILLDTSSILVNLFTESKRKEINLEEMWN